MVNKIKKFKRIRDLVWQEIYGFPETKRAKLLFGEWTIKDVIAHLNNWMVHDIDCLTALKEGKIPLWEPNVDDFNKKGVLARRSFSWNQLCEEFTSLSDHLLNIYQKYPTGLYSSKIWPDKEETPEKFLEEDIDHWTLELKNIKSKLIT